MKWLIAYSLSVRCSTPTITTPRGIDGRVESLTPSEKGTEAPTAEAQPKPIEFEPPASPSYAPASLKWSTEPAKEEPSALSSIHHPACIPND
jgi:hypothetical protein